MSSTDTDFFKWSAAISGTPQPSRTARVASSMSRIVSRSVGRFSHGSSSTTRSSVSRGVSFLGHMCNVTPMNSRSKPSSKSSSVATLPIFYFWPGHRPFTAMTGLEEAIKRTKPLCLLRGAFFVVIFDRYTLNLIVGNRDGKAVKWTSQLRYSFSFLNPEE